MSRADFERWCGDVRHLLQARTAGEGVDDLSDQELKQHWRAGRSAGHAADLILNTPTLPERRFYPGQKVVKINGRPFHSGLNVLTVKLAHPEMLHVEFREQSVVCRREDIMPLSGWRKRRAPRIQETQDA